MISKSLFHHHPIDPSCEVKNNRIFHLGVRASKPSFIFISLNTSLPRLPLPNNNPQPIQHLPLPLLTTPTALDTSRANRLPLPDAQLKSLLNSNIVIQNIVAAKVSRIITVKRELHTRLQELPDRQLPHVRHAAQEDIADRAESQQFSLGRDAG